MLIFERYLSREIGRSFLGLLGLLILIFCSARFVRYLADVASGKIGGDIVFEMLLTNLLSVLGLLIPLTFYIAVVLVLGRLRQDNEITALYGAGKGTRYLLERVLKLAVICAALTAVVAFYFAPWAERNLVALETLAKEESDLLGIAPGRFKELSRGDRVIYVENMSDDRQHMENVFLQIKELKRQGVLTSDEAFLEVNDETGDRFVVFVNGNRYIGKPGQLDFTITEYEKYAVRIELGEPNSTYVSLRETSTSELFSGAIPGAAAELQWRASLVIAVIVLSALAVLLLQGVPVLGRYSSLLVAILIYFTYSNLLGIARSLVKRGDLPTYIGLWWVHLIVIMIGIGLALYPRLRRRWAVSGKQQVLTARQ